MVPNVTDPTNMFDPATKLLTIAEAGWYLMGANTVLGGFSSGYFRNNFLVNGSSMLSTLKYNQGDYFTECSSLPVFLAENDTVQWSFFVSDDTSWYFRPESNIWATKIS